MKQILKLVAVSVFGWIAITQPGTAKELVIGSFISAKSYQNRVMIPKVMKAITKDTNGSLTWKLLAGGQAVSGRGTLAGIRDGIVDIGFVVPGFTPKELASANVVFDMLSYGTGFGTNTLATSAAAVETIMLDCPQCIEDYRKQNAVYLVGYSAASFKLMCKGIVTKLEQVAGKKIRSSGSAYGRWAKQMGAVPVSMPGPSGVPAMQRGAIDCSFASPTWLRSFGYIDVTKSIIDFPMGGSRGNGIFVMNRNTWKSLSVIEKKAIMKNVALAQAMVTIGEYVNGVNKMMKMAAKKKIVITKGGAKFAARLKQHLANEESAIPAAAKKLGVRNPKAIMAAYKKNLTKWEGLTKGIGNDIDKFTAVLRKHIYDRVDVNKL